MLLALKLVLTPFLILTLTLTGRRWGQTISGWMAGLPLNSGPISFLFALEYGPNFAAQAAVGSMGGMAALAVYALAYSLIALRAPWYISAPLAVLVYFVGVVLLNVAAVPLVPTLVMAVAALAASLWLAPRPPLAVPPVTLSRWDLPARIIVATLFVLGITALGEGGLASTFPIFATVLSSFAQRQQGPYAAIQWLRGILIGMYATVAFYLVIALGVNSLPLAVTYALAIAAALAVNIFTLRHAR
jgi:hypothetical protein